jgi:hypothetical protein
VFEARAFIRHHLTEHDLAVLVDVVQSVGSELATHAALESRIPFTLLLERFDSLVRVTVRDDSLLRSVLAVAPPPMALRGRGLRIVQARSRDWGITGRSTSAKAIWASFDVP